MKMRETSRGEDKKPCDNNIQLYTPHGVTSTYDTMVKMYAPWQNSISLIDKHGRS